MKRRRVPTSRRTREMGHPQPRLANDLFERLDGRSLVVFYIKNRVELRDLKQVVHLLGEVQKLQFAALILGRREGADQFTDARAINVVDFLEIQNNLLVAFGEQVAHRVAENDAAFAERDATAAIHNHHTIHLPTTNLHAHWEA